VKFRFRVAKPFLRDLRKLHPAQYAAALKTYRIFKQNPFDPRLRTHKIHRLSAQYGKRSIPSTSRPISALFSISKMTLSGA
jgi:hypothetical protein